jgi:PKD repeat protein
VTSSCLGRRRNLAAGALTLLLALTLNPGHGYAATDYWVGGSDYWQSTTAWSGAPAFPGAGDNAFFTNAATYTVTLTNDVTSIQSNFFSNASNTTATVTLNLNTYELNPAYTGTSPGAFNVGDTATSTTIVYLASSTATGKGLIVPGRIIVGRYGYGILVVTNGNVSVATTVLANGGGGCGSLVLSGPSVFWTNSADLAIGNNSNSFGSTLVISNSALMIVSGTFRVGGGSSQGGSRNNVLLLDTGAKLYTQSGPATIGNYGTPTSTSPSYNNSATVQGGAVWDNGNSSFVIGYYAGLGAATGNVLTVGVGGVVTNISNLTITSSNTLNMAGGFLSALTACAGTLQGFGTVTNDVSISGTGMLIPFNSLGTLTFAKKLTLSSTTTTTVQLGTNSNPTVVQGALTLGGTLNITDGGGFTNGTYTLFTYNSTLASSGLTIGTTPNSNWTYTIDTNSTPYAVNLVVAAPATPPVADFYGNPTAGGAPLTVTFADSSTGTITNHAWSFGDGVISNTMLPGLTHTYSAAGTFDVSLTVSGPLGSSNLTQTGYITVTNVPLPSITNGVTAADAPLQIGNTIVVVAGDTNVFSVGATDATTNLLTYQWSFGDGVTSDFLATNIVEHVYTNDCGPYVASVTISNGVGAITSNFDVMVACQLGLNKVQPKLNFAKTNADSCALVGSFPAMSNTVFAGQAATLDIGGASLTFTFPRKGSAVNGASTFSLPKYNKHTRLWPLKATFKNGSWQTPWGDYSMINSNIPKPGILVSNLPVILLLNSDAFMATTNLTYTGKQGKSGAAK